MREIFYLKTQKKILNIIGCLLFVVVSNYSMMHDAVFLSFWNNTFPIILWAVMSLLILRECCRASFRPRVELTDTSIIMNNKFLWFKTEIPYSQIVSSSIKEGFFRREVLFIEYRDGIRELPVETDYPVADIARKEYFMQRFQEYVKNRGTRT